MVKLVREIDETNVSYGLAREINTVEVPQTQYIDRVMDDPCFAWKMVISVSREACVFLKPVTSEFN